MFQATGFRFYEKGMSLVELIVVIFIIALFSMILISNFPKIQRQYALSNATYKLEQDLRKTEDLGLSGVPINDVNKDAIKVSGYGIYISNALPAQYIIYADVADANGLLDGKYDGDLNNPLFCNAVDQTSSKLVSDCVIEVIDLSKQNPSLYISGVTNDSDINYSNASINFNPPNPTTTITTNPDFSGHEIKIILTNGSTNRTIQVNTSGLINVQ